MAMVKAKSCKAIQFARGGITEAMYNGGSWRRKNETSLKAIKKGE